MANPQKENGYTAIANEILERLVKVHLLGSEWNVLLFIIRKTYGYQKKADIISLSQFEFGTGLSKPTIIKTLKNLMIKKMIIKVWIPGEKEGWTFIKDHEKWSIKTHDLIKDKRKRYKKIGSKGAFTSKGGFTESSKGGFTESSKGGFTHKRKKEIKENVAKSDTPFILEDEIKKLEDNPRRDLNIVALFLDHRKPDIRTYEQYEEALKRHLKDAKSLKVFTNDQILRALDYAKKEYKDIYTLRTLLKILTK